MDRGEGPLSHDEEEREQEIVRLPRHPALLEDPSKPPPRPAGLHALATAGMALFAAVAIVAGIAFLSVGWPGESGRVVIAVAAGGVLGFLACVSVAVLTAARDTYVRPDRRDG